MDEVELPTEVRVVCALGDDCERAEKGEEVQRSSMVVVMWVGSKGWLGVEAASCAPRAE